MARRPRVYAKTVHLYAGLDLIGSKTTIGAREAEIELMSYGMKITSKKTKRCILIPFSNIKGAELLPSKDGEDLLEGDTE